MRFAYGLAGLALVLAFVFYPILVLSFSSGAQAERNGSPVSLANGGGDCTLCHTSFEVNSGTGSVTIDAPKTFMPGETITFTVTVDNTTPPVGTESRQGFQVSVEDDAAVAHVGTFVIVDDENTQVMGDNYVTHKSAGTGQSTWSVGWTAPEDAPETVTIYAAGNAANFNFGPSGDYIYTTSETMQRAAVSNEPEATPLAARLDAIYPNPFAESATVAFTLDRAMEVTVTLYDGVGRAVRTLRSGQSAAGPQTVDVRAGDLAAGTYFVQVRSEVGTEVLPVTLAR